MIFVLMFGPIVACKTLKTGKIDYQKSVYVKKA